MKKFMVLLLVAMSLSLISCNDNGGPEDYKSEPGEQPSPRDIQVEKKTDSVKANAQIVKK